MKMKRDVDIELFLSNLGLGYVVNYLNNRKSNTEPFILPVIDILRLDPNIEKEINIVRGSLNINWEDNIKNIKKKFGKENFNNYLKDLGKVVWREDLPINNNFTSIGKYLMEFVNTHYPGISKEVNKIKNSSASKIQSTWYEDIEIYIVFNICRFTPFIFSRPTPTVKVRHDKKTKEKYLEIKIFSDTSLFGLNRNVWSNIIKEAFPERIGQERIDEDNNLKRFLHYVLRIRGNYSHNEIYRWLNKKGFIFDEGDYSHASQEIKRFREIMGFKK